MASFTTTTTTTEKKELKKEHQEDSTEECAICYETLDSKKNFARTNCKHSFCLTCLMRALKDNNTCPCCRSDIEEKKPSSKGLDFDELVEVAKDEMQMFNWKDHLDAIMMFDNPQSSLKNMLRVFSIGLCRSIVAAQDDEEEWESEDESDDELEEN